MSYCEVVSDVRFFSQGRTNPAFSRPCLFLSDTRYFRHFRRFRWSEEPNPCFQWVECKFVIFAVFVKTAPFWQGTKTRFTKNTVCATPIFFLSRQCNVHWGGPARCKDKGTCASSLRYFHKMGGAKRIMRFWGGGELSGTGDSQRDSRESIRANHSQWKPLFL